MNCMIDVWPVKDKDEEMMPADGPGYVYVKGRGVIGGYIQYILSRWHWRLWGLVSHSTVYEIPSFAKVPFFALLKHNITVVFHDIQLTCCLESEFKNKLLSHHGFIRYDLANHNLRFEMSMETCHVLSKLKVNGRSISCSIPATLPLASWSALAAKPQPYPQSTMQD